MTVGLHQLGEHVVEVKIAQGAIQVIRSADGSPWFHSGETRNRLAGKCAHHRLVALHEGTHQHVGELFGCERFEATAASTATLALPELRLVLFISPELIGLLVGWVDDVVLRTAQRKIDLEDGFEHSPVRRVLHERGAKRVLECITVFNRDDLHGLHRVEVLGETDRQPGAT